MARLYGTEPARQITRGKRKKEGVTEEGKRGGGDKEIWKANEGKGEGVHK